MKLTTRFTPVLLTFAMAGGLGLTGWPDEAAIDLRPLSIQVQPAYPNIQWKGWQPQSDEGQPTPFRPILLTHSGDDSNRVFVPTQRGVIYVFPNRSDVSETNVFLDIEPLVSYSDATNEEGFLGLAFHPQYRENGRFFVYYTNTHDPHQNVVATYVVDPKDPNRADPTSGEILLVLDKPFWNHDGGTICFGPDGFLYIAVGDGGSANDPHGNGQNLNTLLGKVLRIDVNRREGGRPYAIPSSNPLVAQADAKPEIWAYGLRNVWRMAFDPDTGDLWAGDVGQDTWEEIDILVRGGNFGWNLREGQHAFGANGAEPGETLIEPIWEYHHDLGKSITGGFVYRGRAIPELYGAYLYADYVSCKLWALYYDSARKLLTANREIPLPGNIPILSFGEDAQGEAYFTTFAADGQGVYQLLPGADRHDTNPQSAGRDAPSPFRFRKVVINDQSPFEAAGAADFDGDGRTDIFCGDSWYQAPTWQRHQVRQVPPSGPNPHYYEDFANLPLDVNGDGRTDIVTCTYFTGRVAWVENPTNPLGMWIEHLIDEPGPSETAQLVDVNGDGQLDLLPNSVNVVVWYEKMPGSEGPRTATVGTTQGNGVAQPSNPEAFWRRHDLGTAGAGHGVGSGDVNGDGRTDIVTSKGWYEQPTDQSSDDWPFHAEFELGAASVPILAVDVDRDQRTDVVWGLGHDYGLYWLRRNAVAEVGRQWDKQGIDNVLSQVHTLVWTDLNGDQQPELVTGKRVYAHEVEPGATDAPCVACFQFDATQGEWQKHVIEQGQAAVKPPEQAQDRWALKDFRQGTVGTGLQLDARDMDGDGDTDLICPGKSGLYLLENLGN